MTLEETIMSLAQKLLEIAKPLIAWLNEWFEQLEPYQQQEMLHPRKKPRGSIRRRRKKLQKEEIFNMVME